MIFHLNPTSGVPVYLQVVEQVKHAVETGALRPGDQLPTIRKLAEELVINPNTVIRAYRELQHEEVIEIRHGSGAFISEAIVGRVKVMRKAQSIAQSAVERLITLGLNEEEMRRLMENELTELRTAKASEGGNE